jgi:hypothetical protein
VMQCGLVGGRIGPDHATFLYGIQLVDPGYGTHVM